MVTEIIQVRVDVWGFEGAAARCGFCCFHSRYITLTSYGVFLFFLIIFVVFFAAFSFQLFAVVNVIVVVVAVMAIACVLIAVTIVVVVAVPFSCHLSLIYGSR